MRTEGRLVYISKLDEVFVSSKDNLGEVSVNSLNKNDGREFKRTQLKFKMVF